MILVAPISAGYAYAQQLNTIKALLFLQKQAIPPWVATHPLGIID